jgi:hypothetical protein
MTIEEMIKEYSIETITYGPNAGKLIIRHMPKDANKKAELMAAVEEIKKYFADQKAAEDAKRARRAANVAAIPGLQEIEALRDALAKWNDEFEKSFDRGCGGLGVGPRPEGDEEALLKQYPQAAAYLKVQAEAEKNNYELRKIGQKALNRFEDDPSKWQEIVADMDKEISEFADRHMWD